MSEPDGSSPSGGNDGEQSTAVALAAVVEKPRSETAIAALRAEGVYDDARHVQEYGPETVALPVTEPPAETRVRAVIRQIDPEYRSKSLEALLTERGWSEAELASAPGSWAVIGSNVLVTLPADCPDESAVGEALLTLHGEAETVLADEGIENDGVEGTHREPKTRLLAGDPETETIHVEHGTKYALDPTRVMFSPGNQAERVRMGEVVVGRDESISGRDESNRERVFDMFAGIGYFTLPMARAGAQVTAAEINPTAFRYLLENAVLNDVTERVDAYRADCQEVAADVTADRVVMGYYGAGGEARESGGEQRETAPRSREAHEYLPAALEALVPGGVVHYHEATPESQLWERPIERLEAAVEATDRTVGQLETRRVKSHSAGVAHVVVDAVIE
ncbi:class I SAM-dependent methyltransferase family protein [Halobacteria archaeon AArc-dxtr1]|nr:class I SAM-dependent methyltransferase family protein [Halobacteria archaeon AArc-dxtr1]